MSETMVQPSQQLVRRKLLMLRVNNLKGLGFGFRRVLSDEIRPERGPATCYGSTRLMIVYSSPDSR